MYECPCAPVPQERDYDGDLIYLKSHLSRMIEKEIRSGFVQLEFLLRQARIFRVAR